MNKEINKVINYLRMNKDDLRIDNLTYILYNKKLKHCIKSKDCKKCEKCKNDGIEWCEIFKTCKKLSDYCKDYHKIYDDCKYYPEYIEVRKKDFIFKCEKCEKR